ncbi:FecR family protein [uncultured Muribaculum sp.]|uniref:FecR family protein n=1 Tax=uncultured Muribaculum sp. TaxID=1918613 RepID=UPI0025DB645F|nr:FecR family protein [uncultured Muribaculum sp.]
MIKFINNECDENEIIDLDRRLRESPEDARRFFELERAHGIASGMSLAGRSDIGASWLRLKDRIERESSDKQSAAESMHVDTSEFSWKMRRFIPYAAAVAVLVTMAVGIVAYLNRRSEIPSITVAAVDTPREVTLPDGSKVWLNSHSTLSYPEEFTAGSGYRKVNLDGEGYFEVTHDAAVPFVVSSPEMDIRVLGTRFCARMGASLVNWVSLIDGSVRVSSPVSEATVLLCPGQKAVLDAKSGKFDITDVNTSLDAVWHDNVIPFNNANILEIVESLEYLYGVKVVVSDKVDTVSTYSGETKRFDSIEEALEFIAESVPVDFRVEGDIVYLDPS